MKKILGVLSVFILTAVIAHAGGNKETKPAQPAKTTSTQTTPAKPAVYKGQDISLAVLVPGANGIASTQNYLPTMVQGVLVGDIAKHSAIKVLDRQTLEQTLKETESGIYKNEADYGQLGQIANVDYALTGNISKTSTGYAMQIQVVGTGKDTIGITKASYSGSCTIAELDNFTGVRKASLELLTQMGVVLTDSEKQELSGAAAANYVNAQTSLAQGITAQKGGTQIEALSRYIQANTYDPSLAEAASRLNILAANVSSGNIGSDVRNDLQWRDQWVAKLKETDEFYTKYVSSSPPPYTIVYSTDIKQGKIDYEKRTVPLSIEIGAYPDWSWFNTINRVLDTVYKGLQATGRAETWGITWPLVSGESFTSYLNDSKDSIERRTRDFLYSNISNPFRVNYSAYWITVEIINDEGKRIGISTDALPYGWLNDFYVHTVRSGNQYKEIMTSFGIKPFSLSNEITFSAVDPNDITDKLTIKITAINGIPVEQAVVQKNINIQAQPNIQTTDYKRTGRYSTFESGDKQTRIADTKSRSLPWAMGGDGGNDKNISCIDIFPPTSTSINNVNFIDSASIITLKSYTAIIPSSVKVIKNSFNSEKLSGVGVSGIYVDGDDRRQFAQIVIGANVDIQNSFIDIEGKSSFIDFYNKNGKKAGIYFLRKYYPAWSTVHSNSIGTWSYTPYQLVP